MDEVMLHQLHTAGIAYGPAEEGGGGGGGTEKAATLSRLPTRPSKDKGKNLTPLGSEEALTEVGNGSSENLRQGERRRKGEKGENRNSVSLEKGQVMVAVVEPLGKDKKKRGHQRERSWGGNKLLEGDGEGEG